MSGYYIPEPGDPDLSEMDDELDWDDTDFEDDEDEFEEYDDEDEEYDDFDLDGEEEHDPADDRDPFEEAV